MIWLTVKYGQWKTGVSPEQIIDIDNGTGITSTFQSTRFTTLQRPPVAKFSIAINRFFPIHLNMFTFLHRFRRNNGFFYIVLAQQQVSVVWRDISSFSSVESNVLTEKIFVFIEKIHQNSNARAGEWRNNDAPVSHGLRQLNCRWIGGGR